MTWIKDIKGDIINTDKYNKAEISGQGSEVKVKIISTATTNNSRVLVVDYLFEGTKEECKEYMDKLMRDLNGIGKNYFIPSGSKVQTPYILMERAK